MFSKVYGGTIKFCQNNHDGFITDSIDSKLHNKSTKPLSEGHSQVPKYIKAVSRLFSEITIRASNLWIIPTIGTDSVRIYFSDPIIYPVSTCCDRCVYVDLESNLNGSIICPSCNIILASFIHYSDAHNQLDFDLVNKHALFRQKQRQNIVKNRLMYENLTSNKFKTKNLKKVLLNHSKTTEQSKFNNTGDSSVFKRDIDVKQKDPAKDIQEGFILQIKASSIKQIQQRNPEKYFGFNSTANNNKALSQSKYEEQTKRQFDHQLSIEETKKIILDIFR